LIKLTKLAYLFYIRKYLKYLELKILLKIIEKKILINLKEVYKYYRNILTYYIKNRFKLFKRTP